MHKLLTVFFALFSFISTANANVLGTHLQNFNPTSDGMCFVTVHCTQTLEPGVVSLGVFGNYAINSMPFFRNPLVPSTQTLSEPNDKTFSIDYSIAMGIMKNWDIGASFPTVAHQDVENSVQLGTFEETGLTEWKLNTKYKFIDMEKWAAAAVASVNFDRITNNAFSGADSGPTINVEAVFDYRISDILLWGFNMGYRFRDAGTAIAGTGVSPIGDQFIYSTGVAYKYLPWETTFIGELYGSLPVDDVTLPTDREDSNLELLLGAKYTVSERWDLHGGLGTEIYHGLATPDLRIYAGLNVRVGPLMSRAAPMPEPIPVTEEIQQQPIMEEPPDEVIVLHSINFDTNKTTMKAASKIRFRDTIAQLKKKVPDLSRIIVEGHTDSVGTDAHNEKLSQGRAETVRDLLLDGLQSDVTIQAIGRGESRPIASNDNDAGRAKNRRVELKVYRKK